MRLIELAIILLVTLCSCAANSKPSVTPETQSALGVIKRTMPGIEKHLLLEKMPTQGDTDVFELESKGDKIVIRGTTGVAIASGFNYYLKNFCNVHISWCGSQKKMPDRLPVVKEKIRIETPYKYRYYSEKDINISPPDKKIPKEGDVFILGSKESNKVLKNYSLAETTKFESEQSFAIRSFGQNERTITLIEGASRVGTLYGVYAYLEKLGFRFIGLGEQGAQQELTQLEVYAEKLKTITDLVQVSSEDANAKNGFEAVHSMKQYAVFKKL